MDKDDHFAAGRDANVFTPVCPISYLNKDQLSLKTNCITANVLQTNKVYAQCDKLATELS